MNDSDIENDENEMCEEEMWYEENETNKNYQQCMIY